MKDKQGDEISEYKFLSHRLVLASFIYHLYFQEKQICCQENDTVPKNFQISINLGFPTCQARIINSLSN